MAAVAAFLKTRIDVIVVMLLVWESVDESLSIIIGTVQEIDSCFLTSRTTNGYPIQYWKQHG
ncbi:hypothetical protein BofuT4_uP151490.1 [Botrytis cinerea T4]|uniref:Uncharacterized protein n=1 Tax=Botryotinia fuckeliana (strain T4) TaxID=999810 RepID=G2YWL9_BOTF4|nr:hypothetical protein BofuT4_uP151490.1 [Botrytis cinerea T4]